MEGNIVNYITQIRGVSYKPSDLHDSLNKNSIILLRANNINNGKIDFEDVVYVDKSKVSETQVLRKNDILICASSGSKKLVGKAASFNESIECTFGAFCKVIRPRNILGSYLSAFFQSEYYRFHISQLANGANINNIKNEHINSFSIPERSFEEQKEISYKVSSLNGIIESYNRELDLLDELIKARFMEMFGDPVLNEKSWRVIKLGELCSKICSGNTPKGGSDNYTKEGIMFFRSQNVWKNRLELDDIVYIDEATHEKMKETSLNYGDILITKTGRINTENSSLGRSALFLGKNDSANINGHVYLVRINSELVNRHFVLQILISPQYRDLIRRVCVGGIDKRQLNQNHIYDFPIIIPPLELQNQFASFVEEIDKSRSRIQKSLEASQELFDSLMQEYFG